MKNFVQAGDTLSFLASQIVAPTHSTGDTYTNLVAPQIGVTAPVNLVETGDPVVVGRVAGIANNDAFKSTDSIAISTRGVYNVSVVALHHAITVGQTLFINATSAVVSDDYTQVPFGVALAAVAQGGAASTIAVKLFGQTPGSSNLAETNS
jgi:predicted RecA/RadA family phage recombinase